MFTTLRSDAESGLQVDSEHPAYQTSRRPACKNCYARKVYTGENGCYRCLASSITCEYKSSRSKRMHVKTSISQFSSRDPVSEASVTGCGALGREVLPNTVALLELQDSTQGGRTLGVATYSPSFSVNGNLFDSLDVDFEEALLDSTLLSPRPTGFDFSTSDKASEDHDRAFPLERTSCKCLASAVSLLESISIHYVQANLKSVPQIIRHNKSALLKCRGLQACISCGKKSDFAMLLILLCQKIVSSYKRAVVILTDQFNILYRPDQDNVIQVPNMEAAMATAREVDHSLIREYEVEVEEEPCVFGGLVQMQIKKITSFLAALKVMMRQHTWNSHLAMVDVVGNDVKELVRMCRCPDAY